MSSSFLYGERSLGCLMLRKLICYFTCFWYFFIMKINSSFNFVYEHKINKVMHPKQHIFDIFSLDKTKKLGILVCHKSELPIRPNYDGNVLAIDYLEVSTKNKGLGTQILKFAENYSKEIGCNGYMTLKSDCSYTPERIPHTFYRKFGFSTFDKDIDNKLDKLIRLKLNATSSDFPCLLMHYPPKPEKISGFKKFKNFIYKIFSTKFMPGGPSKCQKETLG